MSDWKNHVYRVGKSLCQFDDTPTDPLKHREKIEPWLSAVFQSEHLSLLLGGGLPRAIASAGGGESVDMKPVTFKNFGKEIKSAAEKSAVTTGLQKSRMGYYSEGPCRSHISSQANHATLYIGQLLRDIGAPLVFLVDCNENRC